MTETADDLSAPLGQDKPRRKRRLRLPFTAMQALAVMLGLFLVAFAGFAIFNKDPLGGEPMTRLAIRDPKGTDKASDEKAEAAAAGHGQESKQATKEAPKEAAPGEHKTCTITNNDVAAPAPASLTVIKHVINDNGGTAVASDFAIAVTGTNPSPASFNGVESPGTTVTISPGSYSVAETTHPDYAVSYSVDCSGTLAVEVDGQVAADVSAGDAIELRPRPGAAHVVRLGRTTFYERARRKLRLTDSAEVPFRPDGSARVKF